MRQIATIIIVVIFSVPCFAQKSKTLDRYITECTKWVDHYNKLIHKSKDDNDILRAYITFQEVVVGIASIVNHIAENADQDKSKDALKNSQSLMKTLAECPETIEAIDKIKIGQEMLPLQKPVQKFGSQTQEALKGFKKLTDGLKSDIPNLSQFVGERLIDFEGIKDINVALMDNKLSV